MGKVKELLDDKMPENVPDTKYDWMPHPTMHDNAAEDVGEREVVIEVGAALTDTPYKVRILWGSDPADFEPVYEYRFTTQAERRAFALGAEAAEGYMSFTYVLE
jgi:hypothetical protein